MSSQISIKLEWLTFDVIVPILLVALVYPFAASFGKIHYLGLKVFSGGDLIAIAWAILFPVWVKLYAIRDADDENAWAFFYGFLWLAFDAVVYLIIKIYIINYDFPSKDNEEIAYQIYGCLCASIGLPFLTILFVFHHILKVRAT